MKKLLSVFVVFSFLVLVWCSHKDELIEFQEDNINYEYEVNDDTLTPEEVLARMDKEEWIWVIQWPIEVNIISPEEEKFMPGQARFYKAEIKGLEQGYSCECNWKFYLNEYDEETLYREMSGQCTPDRCGFTSTFIDSRGNLRVHLDVNVKNRNWDIVQTGSNEKFFRVE